MIIFSVVVCPWFVIFRIYIPADNPVRSVDVVLMALITFLPMMLYISMSELRGVVMLLLKNLNDWLALFALIALEDDAYPRGSPIDVILVDEMLFKSLLKLKLVMVVIWVFSVHVALRAVPFVFTTELISLT